MRTSSAQPSASAAPALGLGRAPLELAIRLVHLLNKPAVLHPRRVLGVHPSLEAFVVFLAVAQSIDCKRQAKVCCSRVRS